MVTLLCAGCGLATSCPAAAGPGYLERMISWPVLTTWQWPTWAETPMMGAMTIYSWQPRCSWRFCRSMFLAL